MPRKFPFTITTYQVGLHCQSNSDAKVNQCYQIDRRTERQAPISSTDPCPSAWRLRWSITSSYAFRLYCTCIFVIIISVFRHCPTAMQNVKNVDDILAQWREYKMAVPTYGAISQRNESATKPNSYPEITTTSFAGSSLSPVLSASTELSSGIDAYTVGTTTQINIL